MFWLTFSSPAFSLAISCLQICNLATLNLFLFVRSHSQSFIHSFLLCTIHQALCKCYGYIYEQAGGIPALRELTSGLEGK